MGERNDSWFQNQNLARHDSIRTEADLYDAFQGPGMLTSNISLKEAIHNDIGKVKTYLSNKVNGMIKSASEPKSGKDIFMILTKPFPIVKQGLNYKLEYLSFDIPAGLVEGVLKIPSALAYALLAYMPAHYGLYTTLMPPFIYMLLGTCYQVSFGVTAIEALFLGESVRGVLGDEIMHSEDPVMVDQRVKFTLFLSMMVGFWHLIFKFFRLSFVSVLLADPVMSGFSTGGAFIIATSQLGGFLGISLENSEFLPETWIKAFEEIGEWNWVSIGLGGAGLFLLKSMQILTKKYLKYPFPWQIIIVILSIVVTSELQLDTKHDLKIIGDIPSGFPPTEIPTLPDIEGKTKSELFSEAIVPSFLVALFVYVMTLSLGTFFAGKNGYKVEASQELLAIGVANILSSFTNAFICSASFSRTAVVNSIGGKTSFHNCIGVSLMILAITTITDQLFYLPKTILAAVVLNAVGPMMEFEHGVKYYKTYKPDFFVWLLTFVICLVGGAMFGIYSGVGLALLIIIFNSATCKVVTLGRLPGSTVYRNIERFPMAKEMPGIKILRFDGSLNFANWEKFVTKVQSLALKDTHTIALDASSIHTIDSSSLKGLIQLVQSFEKNGIKLLFANWRSPKRDLLERSGFYDHVTDDTIFLTLHDAVLYAISRHPEYNTDVHVDIEPSTLVESDGHVWHGYHEENPKVEVNSKEKTSGEKDI